MPTPALRPLRSADLPAVCRACSADRQRPDLRHYLDYCLAHTHIECWVAWLEEEIVGEGELIVLGTQGEIAGIVVAPAYRRQGIGRRLVEQLIHQARQRGLAGLILGVDADSSWLTDFYGRLGFVFDKKVRLPEFFGGNEIIYMRMKLDSPTSPGEPAGYGWDEE